MVSQLYAVTAVRSIRTLGLAGLLLCLPALLSAQLNGSYTIGSGGNYATFGAALTALTGSGVSGPVTFNVLNGTYNEQMTIPAITGASAANTITFQAQSGNPADVTLAFTPTVSNNYVVQLNGADYVTLRDLTISSSTGTTYGNAVNIAGDADHNGIIGNVIIGVSTTSSSGLLSAIYSPAASVDSTEITGNTFTDGSWGVDLTGTSQAVLAAGTRVDSNTFSGQGYGFVYLENQNAPRVNANTGIVAGADRAVELHYCDNGLQVQRNRFSVGTGYGIYLYFCDGGSGTIVPRGNVSNNMVHVGGAAGAYGITLSYCTNQNVYFNSVNITGSSVSAGQALVVNGTTAAVKVVDNVFANPGGGYAVYVDGASAAGGIDTSNYNDLYTTGNFVAYWNASVYATLADLQIASGKDAASISVYPAFTSATDLHSVSPWLDEAGSAVFPALSVDFDAGARSVPHDIGADEFTASPATTTPLSGTYSIGSGGTYASFTAAVNDLLLKGVSAAVTFEVVSEPAPYVEHIVITPVPGASASNTVTFQSQSGVASDVVLYYEAAGPSDNYVVLLNGADYIRLRNMTLASNSAASATNAAVIVLTGGVEGLRVEGNTISGTTTTGSGAAQTLIYSDNALHTSRVISNNSFNDGSWAVSFNGYSQTLLAAGTRVDSNTFSGQGYGFVYLENQNAPRVNANTGIVAGADRAVELHYCDNGLQVQRNRFSVGTGYGIYLYFCDGGSGTIVPRGNVSNNMVHVGGAAGAYGITLSYCTNQNVYFNSVNITGSSVSAGQALVVNGTTAAVKVVDNVFANPGGGYAVYVDGASAAGGIDTSNYNDLYTTGNFVAYWNASVYATLADLQNASGKDAASISVYPAFTSATDLHSVSPWLDEAGSAVFPALSVDFDAGARSVPHDIGADEFTASPATTTPLSGTYSIGSGGTYASFTAAVNDLLLKGVSAAVTFEVVSEPAPYVEHIVITPVPGASASNTVTFQSQSGVASDVVLYYEAAGPSDNYVVLLNGADYIRLRNMTLASNSAASATNAAVIVLTGGVEGLRVEGNTISGTTTTGSGAAQTLIYSDNALHTSRVISNNSFNDGSWAVSFNGYSQTLLAAGTRVDSNTFSGQGYGFVYLENQNAPRVNANTGIVAGADRAVELHYCDNGLQVQRNRFSVGTGYGIYLYFCDGGSGTIVPRGNVSNNMVHVGGAAGAYGITLSYCTNQNVYFNSVNITGSSVSAGQALVVNGTTAAVKVVDNVFANPGGGYAVYVDGASAAGGIDTSNYNDLYTTGNFVAYWNASVYATLSDLQAASLKDAASISVYPAFTSATDLHSVSPWLDEAGSAVFPALSVDFDAGARSVPHDIGADEFTASPATTTPLSGNYTIGTGAGAEGGTLADYASFADAIADLNLLGVSGPVVFEVQTGSYFEHFTLIPVPGASASNTVTFQSQSGVASDVTVYYEAAGPSDNYVVLLNGADYIRLRNMTLASNSAASATNAAVIVLTGGVEGLRVEGNTISGTTTTGSGAAQTLIYSDNALHTSRVISKNTFNNGSWAVTFNGYSQTLLAAGTRVDSNTFSGQGYGFVYLENQNAPRVNANTGIVAGADRAVELHYCDNGLQVQRNRFSVGTGYGIYLYFCDGGSGTSIPRGLIANNMVNVGGPGGAYGVVISYSTYQDVYSNSVNITGSNVSAGQALVVNGTTAAVKVVDNVFANPGGGYALYVDGAGAASGIDTSNYNDLYASGTNLAYWNGNMTSLAALQTASGMEANSIAANPAFYSATNLHVLNPLLDSAGTPRASVTDDFDGDARNPSAPDIGADEFSLTVVLEPSMLTGWNMISLPLAVADPSKSGLYPASVSNAFAYLPPPTGYTARDTFVTGTGYWLKFPASASVSITGTPVLKDTIPLNQGWNLVGSTAYPMPKSAVVQSAGGLVASNYFAFNGVSGYGASDTLKPGRAYWVKASAPGTIILDVNNAPRTIPSPAGDEPAADLRRMIPVKFNVSGVEGQGTTLYVASPGEAPANPGLFELPPVPPAGSFDIRFSSNAFAAVLAEAAPAELPLQVQGVSGTLSVTAGSGPAASRPLALIERTGTVVTATHSLIDGRPVSVIVAEGKRFSIAEPGLPASYALDQNYPNPFNPTTTIRYSLPVEGVVSLTVYNVLGEVVATPVEQAATPAGYHSLEVNASAWPTGAYFCTLRVRGGDGTSFSKNLKMLLLK